MNDTVKSKFAKDIVCGMIVNVEQAAGTSTYDGKQYFFCSAGCKKKFDASPGPYVRGEIAQKMG